MTSEARIAALERQLFDKEQELIETRNAAVSIIVGMIKTNISHPADRATVAEAFARSGQEDGGRAMIRLTTLVAAALRQP